MAPKRRIPQSTLKSSFTKQSKAVASKKSHKLAANSVNQDIPSKYDQHKAEIFARDHISEALVHAQDYTHLDIILRNFDLTPKYGPCIGITRLERWQRAEKMKLNPPEIVGEILKSKFGGSTQKESLFYHIV